MQDYIKPLLRKKPDEIILHVGTNDIKDNSKMAEVVAAGILNLGNQIKDSLPCTIKRMYIGKDKANIQNKIKTVNDILKWVTSQNKWTYIDNTNLDYTCLNRGGLHLNRKGSSGGDKEKLSDGNTSIWRNGNKVLRIEGKENNQRNAKLCSIICNSGISTEEASAANNLRACLYDPGQAVQDAYRDPARNTNSKECLYDLATYPT